MKIANPLDRAIAASVLSLGDAGEKLNKDSGVLAKLGKALDVDGRMVAMVVLAALSLGALTPQQAQASDLTNLLTSVALTAAGASAGKNEVSQRNMAAASQIAVQAMQGGVTIGGATGAYAGARIGSGTLVGTAMGAQVGAMAGKYAQTAIQGNGQPKVNPAYDNGQGNNNYAGSSSSGMNGATALSDQEKRNLASRLEQVTQAKAQYAEAYNNAIDNGQNPSQVGTGGVDAAVRNFNVVADNMAQYRNRDVSQYRQALRQILASPSQSQAVAYGLGR